MSEETAGVFVSYSHDDNEWLIRFSKMSKPLSRYAEIDLWSDKCIKAGADWRAEIDKAMANAIVAPSDRSPAPTILASADASG
jgi:hypothetical protein